MENELIKGQRKRLFLAFLVTFSLLFALLGLIVFQGINLTMYQGVDRNLKEEIKNPNLLTREIQFIESNFKDLTKGENTPGAIGVPDDRPPKDFQQVVVLRDKNGKILNEKALGMRYEELQQTKFDEYSLDKIQRITTVGMDNQIHHFNEIMTKVTSKELPSLAYVQLLVNTDQLQSGMVHFKLILLVSMFIAFLVSVFLAQKLTNRALKPIIVGFHKQQEFVANASHELRTPLAIIQGQLESLFLKPERKIEEAYEPIGTSLKEIRRLTRLSNDLLLLAKDDNHQLEIQKKWQTPDLFFEPFTEAYMALANEEGKQLIIKNTIHEKVLFDEDKIQQVMLILLDNALKFTEAGDQIEIFSEKSQKYWLVTIKNNGENFQQGNHDLLFERFYQEDQARREKGAGLGLSIAKMIIENHGGKISAKANQPKGAVFTWQIPIHE